MVRLALRIEIATDKSHRQCWQGQPAEKLNQMGTKPSARFPQELAPPPWGLTQYEHDECRQPARQCQQHNGSELRMRADPIHEYPGGVCHRRMARACSPLSDSGRDRMSRMYSIRRILGQSRDTARSKASATGPGSFAACRPCRQKRSASSRSPRARRAWPRAR